MEIVDPDLEVEIVDPATAACLGHDPPAACQGSQGSPAVACRGSQVACQGSPAVACQGSQEELQKADVQMAVAYEGSLEVACQGSQAVACQAYRLAACDHAAALQSQAEGALVVLHILVVQTLEQDAQLVVAGQEQVRLATHKEPAPSS